MSLSIPQQKIDQVLTSVRKALSCKSLSRKHLQSLLGWLLRIAKCIRPARLFVLCLLDSLRAMTSNYTHITHDMRLDLEWFDKFASVWNGTSMIPNKSYDRVITVDASGSGIGGYDEGRAYSGRITPLCDPVANIVELEAVNVVAAIHTFLTSHDGKTCISSL